MCVKLNFGYILVCVDVCMCTDYMNQHISVLCPYDEETSKVCANKYKVYVTQVLN